MKNINQRFIITTTKSGAFAEQGVWEKNFNKESPTSNCYR
jgi:hypothetical protein